MRSHQISIEQFKDFEVRDLLAASGRKRLTAVTSFHGYGGPGVVALFEVQCDGREYHFSTLAKAIDAYNQCEDESRA